MQPQQLGPSSAIRPLRLDAPNVGSLGGSGSELRSELVQINSVLTLEAWLANVVLVEAMVPRAQTDRKPVRCLPAHCSVGAVP